MNICGIIAEYNPFHNGHLYMIKKIKSLYKDTVIIAIMSGSFTQRGEAAILDKYTRAKIAIENGCDIVFELPFAFATRSGEFFAKGAINILNRLNVVDVIAFGSETNNLPLLKNIAYQIDEEEIQNKIHGKISEGLSYAQAVTLAFGEASDILRQPNATLAIEYLRAIKKFNSDIKPILIERKNANHNETTINGDISSASAIREELKKKNTNFNLLKNTLPIETFEEIKDTSKLYFHENLFKALLAKIYTADLRELENICGINEGLHNRIIKSAKTAETYGEFIQEAAAKRYSKSRISRIATHILLNFTKDTTKIINENETYARLLAFNANGAKTLRYIKKKSDIPIIEKIGKFISEKMIYDAKNLTPLQTSLALDIRAQNLQTLAKNSYEGINKDFLTSPIYIV